MREQYVPVFVPHGPVRFAGLQPGSTTTQIVLPPGANLDVIDWAAVRARLLELKQLPDPRVR